MRRVGIVTSVVAVAAAALAVVVGVRSIPDVRRYLKMRAM
jgi:hypothetical protein